MNDTFIPIHSAAPSVSEAMETRHSIREFLPDPVPNEILERIFARALRAPSWKNSQPWKVHLVSGSTKENLKRKLLEEAKSGAPNPVSAWPESYPSDAKKRMFDLGMKIYGVAGIDRKDKAARDEFMLRNFSFFGAPVVAFITSSFVTNFFVGIDLGCFVQSILLLAREEGLGSCPQAALGAFPQIVQKELALPAEESVLMGISLGYPKADSDLNRYHTPRESLESLVKVYS